MKYSYKTKKSYQIIFFIERLVNSPIIWSGPLVQDYSFFVNWCVGIKFPTKQHVQYNLAFTKSYLFYDRETASDRTSAQIKNIKKQAWKTNTAVGKKCMLKTMEKRTAATTKGSKKR